MALQAPANYSIGNVPDPLAAFQQGQMWRQQQIQQQSAEAKARELQDAIASLPPNASIAQIDQVLFKYPELADRFKNQIATLTQEQQEQKYNDSIPVYAALVSGKPEIAEGIMRDRAAAARNAGDEVGAKNAEVMANLINTSPGTASTSIGMTLAAIRDPAKFAETFGKMEDTRRANELQPHELRKAEAAALAAAKNEGIKVQSSEILPDGSTVIITQDGQTQVRNRVGEIVTGAAQAAAVEQARQAGVRYATGRAGGEAAARGAAEAAAAPVIAGGRAAGEAGVQTANEAFRTATKVSANMANLRRARELAATGADTGVIASKLPNWSAASVELANLRNQLGLDVIGTASFGALSEGELNLALNTALPTNLNQDDLVTWLDSKIAAQDKMRTELMKVARFMSKPGNTLNMWLEQNGGAPAGTAPAASPPAAVAPGAAPGGGWGKAKVIG